MKHRRALFASMWIIAVGVILAAVSFVPSYAYEFLSWTYKEIDIARALLQLSGITVITLGATALAITLLKEYLERQK